MSSAVIVGSQLNILSATSDRRAPSKAPDYIDLLRKYQCEIIPGCDAVLCKARMHSSACVQTLPLWLISYLHACRSGLPQQQ